MQQNYSPKNLLFSQTASVVQKTKFGENNIIRRGEATLSLGGARAPGKKKIFSIM